MSIVFAIPLMLAPVTDPELLRQLNESPPPPVGPAYLVISNGQTIKTIPYKSMKACERARRYVSGPPAGSPAPGGGVYGPPAVTYACVPR